jgi:diacylglycerol kinase family enzyme
VEVDAAMLCVINVGSALFGNRPLVPGSAPDDGLLDVLAVAPAGVGGLARVARGVALGYEAPPLYWRVRRAAIHAVPEQSVDLDGALVESTPAVVEVLPRAVGVVVPPARGTP